MLKFHEKVRNRKKPSAP